MQVEMLEYVYMHICMGVCMHACMYVCMYVCRCHKGVVFQTIKSFVCALDVYLQMTEATNK